MPSRNIYKLYIQQGYYHVYNRGFNKAPIFLDRQDYKVFISLIERYMGMGIFKKGNGIRYEDFSGRLDIIAFCLMSNHFHFFVQQHDEAAMRSFMKRLTVAYSMYFNKRYKRVGPLFQQRYRACLLVNDAYFLHLSRYIHLNPRDWKNYEWSSIHDYLGRRITPWLKPETILEHFAGRARAYETFVADYEDAHTKLEEIKHILADR